MPYDESDGTRSFREKIDLLAPHGLSGTASRSKRGVPALQPAHGKLSVGNALGLELAAFNRSLVTITDFADSRLAAEIHVAEIPALILAKGSKIGERLREPRKGAVRDKDLGDLWRLMAVADPLETAGVIAEFIDHSVVGADVSQSVQWTAEVLRDPVSVERAKLAFDTFVRSTASSMRGAIRFGKRAASFDLLRKLQSTFCGPHADLRRRLAWGSRSVTVTSSRLGATSASSAASVTAIRFSSQASSWSSRHRSGWVMTGAGTNERSLRFW